MKNSFTYGFYDELSKLAAGPLAAALPVLGRIAAQAAGSYLVGAAADKMTSQKTPTAQHHTKPVGETH